MTNRDPIEINGRIWTYDPTTSTHRPTDTKAASDNIAFCATKLEPDTKHALYKACKNGIFDSRVSISVRTQRFYSCDTENVSIKAAIDGIVACRILEDDTPEFVAWVTLYAPTSAEAVSKETTEIVIEEIN